MPAPVPVQLGLSSRVRALSVLFSAPDGRARAPRRARPASCLAAGMPGVERGADAEAHAGVPDLARGPSMAGRPSGRRGRVRCLWWPRSSARASAPSPRRFGRRRRGVSASQSWTALPGSGWRHDPHLVDRASVPGRDPRAEHGEDGSRGARQHADLSRADAGQARIWVDRAATGRRSVGMRRSRSLSARWSPEPPVQRELVRLDIPSLIA